MFGFIAKILSKFAVEPLPKTILMLQPQVKKLPLKENQYYKEVFAKKHIFLHHTAGGSAASSIAGWAETPTKIATPYVIDRDGTIYECYDPKYWAYSLGVKGLTSMERSAIPIEIACYGALTERRGKWYTYTNREISKEKTVQLSKLFRGFQVWEAYTPEQISSLKALLPYLIDRFKIKLQVDRKNFWEWKDPAKLPSGIYSHTTVRKDKIDIFPQEDLINLVYGL